MKNAVKTFNKRLEKNTPNTISINPSKIIEPPVLAPNAY